MSETSTNVRKTCQKCLENVRLYIVCFKCDLTYHPNCWRKLPGAYLNEKGHAFCCWNIELNQDVSNEDLETWGHVEESITEEEFSGNCKLIAEDLQNKQKLSIKRLHLIHNKGSILVKQNGEPKRYKCADCKYSTHQKQHLQRHIYTHTNDRPFKCRYKNCECTDAQKESCKCSMCRYAAARKELLEMHILTKHTAEPKKYKCADCRYSTHQKHHLHQHIRTHTDDRPFKCMYKNCECTVGQEESCKCSMCMFAAAHKATLTKHILAKHSAEPKKYNCANCSFATHQRQNLERHVRTHTNDRPFKCTYKNCECTAGQDESCKCSMCGYAATQNSTLKEHILRKHSAEPKKYQCANCRYFTHHKQHLVRHVRTHTNDRPFKCTYKNCECTDGQDESCKCSMCGYAAAQNSTLKEHILRKHSAEPKKYKCADCKYVTYRKENLKQHLRTHTNPKILANSTKPP